MRNSKRFMLLRISTLFLFYFFIVSCSDEFGLFNDEISILDSYDELVAVYANVNVYDSIHYIRINRGYAAENFANYASCLDSLYFKPEDIEVNLYVIRVQELDNDIIIIADTLAKFICRDTIFNINNAGGIGIKQQPLFYFKEKELSKFGFEDIYLGVEAITKRKKVYGHTKLVDGGEFRMSQYAQSFPIENNTFDVFIIPPLYAQSLIAKMHCQYLEVRKINGRVDSVFNTFDVLLANDIYNDIISEEQIVRYRNNTKVFFNGLERDIILNGDTINTIKRKLHKVYFSTFVGNADLMEAGTVLNFNGSGFNDQPIYVSNIKNGLGYFTSYGNSVTRKYWYSQKTVTKVIELYGQKYHFAGK